MPVAFLVTGAVAVAVARAAAVRALLAKLRRDVARLNAGDHAPLLSAYAPGALLRFAGGDHRWAGTHEGREAIERFLRELTRAGIHGEVRDLLVTGPPWGLRMIARFDDWALGADGRRIYRNRTCIVIRTRWGKIVEQDDFYEDTARILAFEQDLRDLGMTPLDG